MSFLFADSPADVDRLRERFAEVGFNALGVDEALGPRGANSEPAPLLHRTKDGSPLSTLIRLFVGGVPVERQAANQALDVEAGAHAGIVSADGDSVVATIRLRPVAFDEHEWLVPSDFSHESPDYVTDVGPASMTLAGLTIRQPVARCLDLGTAGGIQALHASTHAGHVVATDSNARAVAFAEFTMRLNGIANVEARQGDRFAPVADERFGLIVSNPPFVISPEARFTYRDSGMKGDEFCRTLVTEAPAHLEDGGWCQLLANWAHVRGEHWQDRVAEWIDEIGCDAWIVQSRVEDAETYASNWLRQEDGEFDEWMDYYDRIGLEAVGFGLITLRRTSRDHKWLRMEELAREFALPCGDEIASAFDRGVWLTQTDDRALLDATLVVNPTMVFREINYAAEGQWHLEEAVLTLTRGLRYSGAIDPAGAQLIAGCDGATPLRVLVQRLAESIGVEATDITPNSLLVLRRLVQEGFVTPA